MPGVRIRIPDFKGELAVIRAACRPTKEDMIFLGNFGLLLIYNRTAIEGKDRFGNQFPSYSTRPMYVSPRNPELFSIAKRAGGRTEYMKGTTREMRKIKSGSSAVSTFAVRNVTRSGRRNFADPFFHHSKTGTTSRKKMVTIAFDGGWAQLKAGSAPPGRANAGQVNLVLTGKLMGTTGVFEDGENDAAFGITGAEETKVMLGFTRADRELIAQGLVERGFDFWGLGDIDEERAALVDVLVQDRIIPRLQGALQ